MRFAISDRSCVRSASSAVRPWAGPQRGQRGCRRRFPDGLAGRSVVGGRAGHAARGARTHRGLGSGGRGRHDRAPVRTQGALRAGGRTVAVICTGTQRHFPPESRELHREVAEQGAGLSQFWPDRGPDKTTFPMRNGTMSGYSLATIIVEAGERSGTRIPSSLRTCSRGSADLADCKAGFEAEPGGVGHGFSISGCPGCRALRR